LYKTDNINGTDGVAFHCTNDQFSEMFLTGKLVRVQSKFGSAFCLHILTSWYTLSHKEAKGNTILVAFCDSNGYLPSALNQNDKRAVWLQL